MAFFTGLSRFRAVVITTFAFKPLPHLRFEPDIEAIIPTSDPVHAHNAQVEDLFGLGDPLVVGVINKNPAEDGVFNSRTLRIVIELSAQIARLPCIKASRRSDVASMVIAGFVALMLSQFRSNFYLGSMVVLTLGPVCS